MTQSDTAFHATLQKALMRLLHLTMRSFWAFARDKGLSFPQLFALRHVRYTSQCNISDIGAALGVSNAAASQLLDRLVQQGLIERREDPADRRNKLLVITEAGLELLQESNAARQSWMEELFHDLTETEQSLLSEAFALLLRKTDAMVGGMEKDT